jgi:hypothetical protein
LGYADTETNSPTIYIMPHDFSEEWLRKAPADSQERYVLWHGSDGEILAARNPVANLKQGNVVWIGANGKAVSAQFKQVEVLSSGDVAHSCIAIEFKTDVIIQGRFILSLNEFPPQEWANVAMSSAEKKKFINEYLKANPNEECSISSRIRTKRHGEFIMAYRAILAGPDGLGSYSSWKSFLFKKNGENWVKFSEEKGIEDQPVMDIDGDGFPEYIALHQEGGTYLWLWRAFPKHESLFGNSCD